jgi:hypothetical protein
LTGHPARDKSVVLGGEEVELGYPHAPHGCSEIRERERDVHLGAELLESENVRAQMVV